MDEFQHCTKEAKEGILFIRSLANNELLEAARSTTSPAFQKIFMNMAPNTNPTWIRGRCASEAYDREIMEAEEMTGISKEDL